MLRDKKILKIIIKMFSKYGIIADTENIVDNERKEYVSINEILYLINQLITLYILKTAIEGIEEIKRFNEEMYYTDLKYKSKLKQVFCYIFDDVKYDPKIYDKETEKEEYYINCRKEIVDYINKRNDLFEQVNNKFLYNKKYDVIEYKQQNYKILSILWRNYTESLTASRFEKSKKPSICPICHMPYYKTSNNQKRCSKHSRDEICKQEKQELYDKILETYNNYKLDKKIKKEIEDKILNKKNIREIKKDDLRRLLEKLKSQK